MVVKWQVENDTNSDTRGLMGILSQMFAEPDPDWTCRICGGKEFLEGPHGGDSVNFACKECWARYNDCWPFMTVQHGFVSSFEREAFQGKYVPRRYPG